ncbi:DUF3592 domain-containing protein [Actinotalea sp. Marseille-Q4924]|uniref:DUF3592 domain-containing protein n=1 Tax=Actinotalea sp. Marseille-Q4924 TaxID=2866571 RepID=UPI001CE4AF73|nr:DUF3592 domain-containing protein [Actinotalea sp. Marseille-Q4924]
MVLVVAAVLLAAAGVHMVRRHRIPPGAEPLPGEVVEVAVKRSSISGSSHLLYAPTVAYRDRATGERRLLPPASHQPRAYEVGEQVTLMQLPDTREVRLPLPQPRRQMALPFVLSALALALGVADLAG